MGNFCLSRNNQPKQLLFLDEKERTLLKDKYDKLMLNNPASL